MAYNFHAGAETGNLAEFTSSAGSPSVQGTYKKTGNYAIRFTASGSSVYVAHNVTTKAFTMYLYIVSAPSSDTLIIGNKASELSIVLKSTRYLEFWDGSVLEDTGSTQLNIGQWYRLSGSYADKKVYLDGIEECSATSLGYDSWGQEIGVLDPVTADIVIDDFLSADSGSDPGDIRVLAARPIANGTDLNIATSKANGWADSTDADYASYDELDTDPPSTASFNCADNNNTDRYSVTLDECGSGNLAGIGGSDTIEAVHFMWYYETEGGGADDYGIRIRCSDDGGSPLTNDNIDDPKTATWYAGTDKYHADTPVGGNPWTQAYVNSLEMGMATITSGSKGIWWYEAYAMVAYKVAEGGELFLAGTATGASTASGIIKSGQELVGTITATSGATGAVSFNLSLAGSVAGQSTTSAAVRESHSLTGSTAGQSGLSSAVVSAEKLGGSVTGQSGSSAVTIAAEKISGSLAANSAVSGVLSESRALTGTISAASALSSVLTQAAKLIGQVTNLSTTSASLKFTGLSAGTIVAQSSASASLSQEGEELSLAGVIAAQSTASASIKENYSLIGNISGQGSVVGSITQSSVLAGVCAATSDASAVSKSTQELAGTTDAQSTAAAVIKESWFLVGSIATQSSADAIISTAHSLTGTIPGQSTSQGNVVVVEMLTGLLAAQATTSAALKSTEKLVGSLQGQSSVSAELSFQYVIGGTVSSQSSITGIIALLGRLIGSISSQSIVSAAVKAWKRLVGSLQGQSVVSGILSVAGEEEPEFIPSKRSRVEYSRLTRYTRYDLSIYSNILT